MQICVQNDDNSQQLKKVFVRLHRLTAEIAKYQTVEKITSKKKFELIDDTSSKKNGKILKRNVQENYSDMVDTKGKPKRAGIVDKATNKRKSDHCFMNKNFMKLKRMLTKLWNLHLHKTKIL